MSYNFNPQPNFSRTSGGLSTASMHTVTPPTISSPFSVVGTYQLGAVRFAQQAQLGGSSALNSTFTKGVISFWSRYSGDTIGDSTKLYQIGSFSFPQPNGGPDIPIATVAIGMGNRTLDLYLIDGSTSQFLLLATINYGPVADWHHYICSFDVGQLVPLGQPKIFLIDGWINGPGASIVRIDANTWFVEPAPIPASMVWNGTNGLFTVKTPLTILGSVSGSQQIIGPPNFNFYTYDDETFISGQTFTMNVFGQPSAGGAEQFIGTYSVTYNITGQDFFGTVSPFPYEGTAYTNGPLFRTVTPGHRATLQPLNSNLPMANSSEVGVQILRAQWAMDRGGGPIAGGPLMDTAATEITDISQPMYRALAGNGSSGALTGTLLANTTDRWSIGAPFDAHADFAYCYMGLSGNFFDLTVPGHLDYFVSPQLTPVDLGFQGQKVPLLCNWMHTGATQPGAGGPYFAVNAPNGKVWTISGGTMTATDGPPIGA